MQINPLIEKFRTSHPHLVTPFIGEYFRWADVPTHQKPYFYGKWSLKWALEQILPALQPSQVHALLHHILSELATNPDAETVAQYQAITLMALRPWKQQFNDSKKAVNISELPTFMAGGFKFISNTTADNLTAMIFRKTNADAILFSNPETGSAGIILRANSRINRHTPFKDFIQSAIFATEPGWKIITGQNSPHVLRGVAEGRGGLGDERSGGGDCLLPTPNSQLSPTIFINHGIQSHTPSIHTTQTLQKIIELFFD